MDCSCTLSETNEREIYRELFKPRKQTGGSNPFIGIEYQKGYGFTPFIGKKRQRGYGLGNILGGFFRSIIPMVKPVLKKAAVNVGKRALKGGIEVAKNVLEGKNIKEAIKDEAKQGLFDLKNEASIAIKNKLNQNSKKNKNSTKRKSTSQKRIQSNKKQKTTNIFS